MNTSINLNIVVGGHFSYEALRDNVVMLEGVLKACDFKVNVREWPTNEDINLVYEGHHPDHWQTTLKALESIDKSNLVMVCTEEVVGSKLLHPCFLK